MAMHITGGILTITDMIVCGAVIIVCVVIIVHYICKFKGKKN